MSEKSNTLGDYLKKLGTVPTDYKANKESL